MFDLSLLRTPTFAGGSIAAFAMNGSLYAVLLWLVIYLQDILGYSAQSAGLRLAIISGAQFDHRDYRRAGSASGCPPAGSSGPACCWSASA